MGIFNVILFLCFIFLYEETKYIPLLTGQSSRTEEIQDPDTKSTKNDLDSSSTKGPTVMEQARSHHGLDLTIPRNSWRTRLALTTPTPEPIWPHFYRPFGVLIFPAVAFAALQYAAGVVWLTVLSNVLALTFPMPPYLFSPEQIGYSSAGPLIGNILGAVYGGFLGDRSILYYARRNKGYYEPEMRLYILHIPAILMAGGLIMFGATISRVSWLPKMVAASANMAVLGNALDLS
jgi:hypothetical protein